ncbi:MAG TPA: hypothetical protein VFB82_07285 [Blastocatellia bacterium]|jgi:predicted RND superfamily exporter protein|nr:hypothetical protein [Blastocatellia bacterium]
MKDTTKHKLVWGWLRLFLGFVQMSLVAASVGALIAFGLHSATLILVIGATATTLLSRLLYHGRRSESAVNQKQDSPVIRIPTQR